MSKKNEKKKINKNLDYFERSAPKFYVNCCAAEDDDFDDDDEMCYNNNINELNLNNFERNIKKSKSFRFLRN